MVADEAWGIWEALEVVYSKARDSSVCGILEGPWRACPGEEGRKKKKLQKEFLADLQSSESPGSSGKTAALLQEVAEGRTCCGPGLEGTRGKTLCLFESSLWLERK